MGKGDKKSKRGKIIKGSFGNSRLKRRNLEIKEGHLSPNSKTGLNIENGPEL